MTCAAITSRPRPPVADVGPGTNPNWLRPVTIDKNSACIDVGRNASDTTQLFMRTCSLRRDAEDARRRPMVPRRCSGPTCAGPARASFTNGRGPAPMPACAYDNEPSHRPDQPVMWAAL
eukprot:6174247-Prymnesium_polylepis.1